jgi:hypothetical protein
VVLEVTFDVVQRSARHKAGTRSASRASSACATTSRPSEVDTLAAVRALAEGGA